MVTPVPKNTDALSAPFVEQATQGPEVFLYHLINTIGGVIWRHNHAASHGRPSSFGNEEMPRLQAMVEFAVDQTTRFGVSTPRDSSGSPTPEYWLWFRWWDAYVQGLSTQEFDVLDDALDKGVDVSQFRPQGDWRQVSVHDPAESTPHALRITFAPGVLDALFNTRAEEARAQREGYRFYLGDMDIAHSALAHDLLTGAGIDHASPAGYVAFKTAQMRLAAIQLLSKLRPSDFGWKWRVQTSGTHMSTEEWVMMMTQQPLKAEYLEGTDEANSATISKAP